MKSSLTKFALTATLGLAITLTLNACEEKAGGSTFTDERDGKKYKTTKIGEQVWMAENLNYAAKDSKCYGEGQLKIIEWKYEDGCEEDCEGEPIYGEPIYTPAEIQANCQKYGRLYNWKTAMKACPKGWKLPSEKEWEVLTEAVGGENTVQYLNAKSGWEDRNGEDKFGFTALPGGKYGILDPGACDGGCEPGFWYIGYGGYWWSSSESPFNSAYSWYIGQDFEDVDGGYVNEGGLRSVRCIQN